jgi:RNA polymerase sigma-70 factor (ECF subfamily)
MGEGGFAMSGTGNEFERLMQRVRTGDPLVGKELFERYGKAIQMVVRYRLDPRLRSQFDSLDFAQDAWASFFRRPAEDFAFQTPEDLVAFLTQVARHKIIDAYRQRCRHSKKNGRTFRRSETYIDDKPARQPTPSQMAIGEEAWRRLLRNKPPKIQLALEMLRDGYSQREIAQRLELNVKRIQRLIKRLNDSIRSP